MRAISALISRRAYKEPLPLDKAIRIIEEGRGSHFDPDIVDAFLVLRDEFAAIAQRYADHEDDLRAKQAQRYGVAAMPVRES
jgi:putative two-component system response regulator